MILALIIFFGFTLVVTAFAFVVASQVAGKRRGAIAAALTLLGMLTIFAALYIWVWPNLVES